MIILLVLLIGGVTAGGAGAALVYTGSPEACGTHEIRVSNTAAASLDAKWEAFRERASDRRAQVTFTESEVTSRAAQYIVEQDLPLDNIQIYFCSGRARRNAEMTATYTGGGPDIDVLVVGTLVFGASGPNLHVKEVKGGNLPGWIPVARTLTRVSEDARRLNLGVAFRSLDYGDGRVTLTSMTSESRQPRRDGEQAPPRPRRDRDQGAPRPAERRASAR